MILNNKKINENILILKIKYLHLKIFNYIDTNGWHDESDWIFALNIANESENKNI